MVAHQIAVVAGEHDHGVVGEAELIETLEDLRHAVVDHGDHAERERDGLARLLLVNRESGGRVAVAGAVIACGMQRECMRRQRAVADAEGGRQLHILRLVQVPVAARRRERMMRVRKRALQKERRVAVRLRCSRYAMVRSIT